MSNTIDLHGFDVLSALDSFVGYYNDRVRQGDFRTITVIHGYGASGGEGKIRARLRSLLAAHPHCLSFEPGEHLDFHNLGETLVFPNTLLPSAVDQLSGKILEFCGIPKTKTKIVGKFRQHGETKIHSAIQSLEKQRLLVSFVKGKHKLYQRFPPEAISAKKISN